MGKKSFFAKLKEKLFFRHKKTAEDIPLKSPREKDNPYLPHIREITEAVLAEKKIHYRDFFPVFVDGEEPEKTLLAAQELGPDLNRMAILTGQSGYFEDYRDTMYEEEGLIIEIFSKEKTNLESLLQRQEGNTVILDFEKEQELINLPSFEEALYIPIFKRPWESTGNLDIAVPIGYNTLIVRGIDISKKQPVLDKFEQAFYRDD